MSRPSYQFAKELITDYEVFLVRRNKVIEINTSSMPLIPYLHRAIRKTAKAWKIETSNLRLPLSDMKLIADKYNQWLDKKVSREALYEFVGRVILNWFA